MDADPGRLSRILARLEPADAAWVGQMLGDAAWRARERRLSARDAAVRAMAPYLTEARPTRAASELAQMLNRYFGGAWKQDAAAGAPPPDAHPSRQLLYRIAQQNEGKALGHAQVYRIMCGQRTPQS